MATGASKVSLSICRIRKRLSGNQGSATIGSGCIIGLKLGDDASNPSRKNSAFLITTTQVITKNDLISASTSIVVDFLDGGKLLKFNLGFKYATDFPGPISGRVLEGTGDAFRKEVSFIVIPVEKFDDRSRIKRAISFFLGTSFEKRSLACSHQSDGTLQSAVSRRKVLCHVIRDGRNRNDASYNTEPYCLEFGKDTSEFALTSPLDHDGADDMKKLKDFHKEEKPKGAPILSAEGEFVGMLAIASSDERKLFPLFLPSTSHTLSNEITVQTETSMEAGGGNSDQEAADKYSCQEEKNKSSKNNNPNLAQPKPEGEHAGNEHTTSEVQESGKTLVNLPQLNNSSPAANAELFPEDVNPVAHTPPSPHPVQPPEEQDVKERDCSSDSSLEQENDDHLDESAGDSLSRLNENAHDQSESTDGPIRPNLLTQNSCYADDTIQPLISSGSDEDEEGYGGVLETASTKPFTGDPRAPGIRSHRDIVSQAVRPNITHHNTSHGELEHVSPGCLVKDKIVSKIKIMDRLSLHLDRSVCPGSKDVPLTQRWEHLADELKVPDTRKRQCGNITGKLSPSENMFEFLCTTQDTLPIKTIKDELKNLGRNDVVAEFDKNSGLPDAATVTDLCENHPETLNAVCLKLDDKRGPINWHDVGLVLGITGGTLWKFEYPSGYSPSEAILKKIETVSPSLRITTIEAALAPEQLNRQAVANVLNGLPDGSTIQTLLDDFDVLEKVTAMLDRQESSWYNFGRRFNIDRKELDILKPDPIPSPTKEIMDCIVQDNPNLTMKAFLETLTKLKRLDVIKELKGFFHPNDIDAIVREITHQAPFVEGPQFGQYSMYDPIAQVT